MMYDKHGNKFSDIDEQRVNIFRASLGKDSIPEPVKQALSDLDNESILAILNMSVLPNSISLNALKYNYMLSRFANRKTDFTRAKNQMDNIDKVCSIMTKQDKSILKFGIKNGYRGNDWNFHMTRFVYGSGLQGKTISSYYFKRAFGFSQELLVRAENNDIFPKM
ncbi:hypothetical protein ACHJH3_11040 [Campylobacter sp. MOP7]|uniref:hypothetical protein n=1 Tax=Campylobacter canis TaxID=3378588 RepID=UPI00387E597D